MWKPLNTWTSLTASRLSLQESTCFGAPSPFPTCCGTDEYAVSSDGVKMFGIMELETQFAGCRFAIGIRNCPRQVHASRHDRGLPGIRLREHGVQRRL